ncbi:MAG: oligoribonuclease [Deltaproteobacteria bacterium]|nr:oligoribonuclease [Deltaproteobacteria bacterium]
MSGLDPETDHILEIAVLITDGELNLVAEGPELVVHQPESVIAAMDAWNTEHHGASGLIERVRASTVTVAQADQQVRDFVAAHCAKRAAPLAGNSIHQDRRFVCRYMPLLDAYLHYRNVDVSSLKELCRRWYPEAFAGAPKKKGTHRALDDIYESIAELRYYRREIFR